MKVHVNLVVWKSNYVTWQISVMSAWYNLCNGKMLHLTNGETIENLNGILGHAENSTRMKWGSAYR